jgi:hypothetical protein
VAAVIQSLSPSSHCILLSFVCQSSVFMRSLVILD